MDNFEDVLNQHKEKARKVYAESGEGNLVNSAMREIESNCADYEYYFQMGQQSKQKRIDELQARVDAFKAQSEKLRECSKSCVYNEREKNILLSQADDIDQILGAKQALKGGEV
ncbi:hypothetical protein [Acinetobacter soli]|uniref:hypothetical protein n=1 Tax=Acinetobacter soli TaxID=487316 RepID=UPI0012505D3C|nr:hypothetical protein [Acinetobacter soli]